MIGEIIKLAEQYTKDGYTYLRALELARKEVDKNSPMSKQIQEILGMVQQKYDTRKERMTLVEQYKLEFIIRENLITYQEDDFKSAHVKYVRWRMGKLVYKPFNRVAQYEKMQQQRNDIGNIVDTHV